MFFANDEFDMRARSSSSDTPFLANQVGQWSYFIPNHIWPWKLDVRSFFGTSDIIWVPKFISKIIWSIGCILPGQASEPERFILAMMNDEINTQQLFGMPNDILTL